MGELEVYASPESLEADETLKVKVSTNLDSAPITAEVFRIGDYGGAGARKVWSGGPWQVRRQAPCTRMPATSRVECNWHDAFTVPIPADGSWLSGLYVVKVLRQDGFMRFTPFVVRDRRKADFLYTPNFTTYQAYNTYGGESLYSDDSRQMPSGRAWEVSFNRPYQVMDGTGKTFYLDQPLVSFMERHGYDVTYATQLDFVRFPDLLKDVNVFVHGGQDEYWPVQERDQVDAALARGQLSLVYFGANGSYWRVRLLPDAQGTALRTIACYKSEPQKDPVPFSTTRYRDPPEVRAENNLFGGMYEGWVFFGYPLVVSDESHWLFNGTGLKQGDVLPGLVGFEYDRAFPNEPGYPQGNRVSFKSPVVSGEGLPSYSTAVDRTLPSGRLVFSAGTIWWALGLTDKAPGARDARVERMTRNVLERALMHRLAQDEAGPLEGPVPTQPAPMGQWAASVEAHAGRVGEPGWQDGPADTARFQAPSGLVVTRTGEVVVADTRNNRIRLIQQQGADRMVSTIAGNGDLGYRDGAGSQAMFRFPTAVVEGPAGELYVADSGNHVIRRLDREAEGWQVTTWAGQGYVAGYADGGPARARLSRPMALAIDAVGNLYVADQDNHRIRMVRAGTREVITLAGTGTLGTTDAPRGRDASFAAPSAIALSGASALYVLDAASQRLRRVSLQGARPVVTLTGTGEGQPFDFRDGTGSEARFRAQLGMAMGPHGEVLLADTANLRLRKVIPGDSAATTQVVTFAGSGRAGTALGRADETDLGAPAGLAFDAEGHLYVSDAFNQVIRVVTP
ncbi:N,N-dimethylformamidase beta subunit family domain-containing protein [Corallococcus sp. EGB]|uniref:N,N-dimethylformamidase beta subunit family domain-containing protein n=1 Tax=Corallococcus sp. EGB TaxID=1521117 RepID=UPI001CBF4630|nr:N,N-dimethylformamidase beta subunit family domain-containing protein [Corallococcus sp. EGB]